MKKPATSGNSNPEGPEPEPECIPPGAVLSYEELNNAEGKAISAPLGVHAFDGDQRPISSAVFDYESVELGSIGITLDEAEQAGSPVAVAALAAARGGTKALEELRSNLPSRRRKRSPSASSALLGAEAAGDPAKASPPRDWTLPDALARAEKMVRLYPTVYANDTGWGALALGNLLGNTSKSLSDAQLAELDKLGLVERIVRLAPPGTTAADCIVSFIRLNPGLLVRSAPNAVCLRNALVDLLEAAHFGTCANRVPGLLPEENRKKAASVARAALKRLASSRTGNPPDYPPEFLASILKLILAAFKPMKELYGTSGLKEVRSRFGGELKNFSDKKLKALLTSKLYEAAAQMAEDATKVSAESFLTAWAKLEGGQKQATAL